MGIQIIVGNDATSAMLLTPTLQLLLPLLLLHIRDFTAKTHYTESMV